MKDNSHHSERHPKIVGSLRRNKETDLDILVTCAKKVPFIDHSVAFDEVAGGGRTRTHEVHSAPAFGVTARH